MSDISEGQGPKKEKTRKKKTPSITRQISLVFLVMLGIVMLAMFLANTFLLEKFYEQRLERTLVTAFQAADSHVTENGLDQTYFSEIFSAYAERNNIICTINDENYEPVLVYGAGIESGDIMSARLNGYIWGIDQGAKVVKNGENYSIQKKRDDHLNNSVYLELYGTFTRNNYHILLRVPVESIRTSAKISNEFVFYMIILSAFFSVIMIHYVSGLITKPIRELTGLSERMANLDFNARYTSGGKNEIGQLGEHFNQMSSTLEKTISELKTANNELQENLDAKTRAEQERREFLSNVSHELKTPLALIQGYAEGLQDCVNDDEESRNYYCSVIIDEAGKMNTLVRKLMALNQLESGYDKVEMVRFDLAELIRGKAASTKLLAEQKNATISLTCPEVVHVWGDEFKVEEVLTNYMSNAINHVEGDLKIEVRVEEDRGRHKVRTTVRNTGKPIPEEDIDHVWDKFFKVDKARTRAYGGSGVGLAIVRAIMDSFHQKYGVRNVDDGVEFWFELEEGDGELVDEEISDEREYRDREEKREGRPSSEGRTGAGLGTIFSRTAGSAENDRRYQEKMKKQAEAAARREAVRKAREEEEKPVDAAWVPVVRGGSQKGSPAGEESAERKSAPEADSVIESADSRPAPDEDSGKDSD